MSTRFSPVIVFVVLSLIALDAKAHLQAQSLPGKVSGVVTNVYRTYGLSGAVNSITLFVFQTNGVEVEVVCHRADQTLGWCDPVLYGDAIIATGNLQTPNYMRPVTSIEMKD